jgi:alpha-glucosidase
MRSSREPWWRSGVLYQVYPRSFADSTGDGIGDLVGIRKRLDYLQWLGVDGIWLNPTFPSPNKDWGYDVSDYCAVHPDLGTLADLEALVADARARGISVLLDLVPAHTSDQHRWFVESRSSRETPRRNWYIWRDEADDQESVFGGSAWARDAPTGQYYHHLFLAQQPDLNWVNPDVRDAFDEILRFWFDRGIAGFRIDVVHELVKDPPDRGNDPETHRVLRRWRALADTYEPPRILVGETWMMDLARLATFHGTGTDQLHLAFNFPFLFAGLEPERLAEIVRETEHVLPDEAWPVWTFSNHDVVRFPTRICASDERKVRCALLILLGLRGTPVLYYGDELGMPQTEIAPDRVLDVRDRDGARTPMPWGDVEWHAPWLPLGEDVRSVAEQREDPGSVLSFTRELIALRHARPELATGDYERIETIRGVWAWRRGSSTVVAVNLSGDRAEIDLGGRVLVSTNGSEDTSSLEPWAGVVLDVRSPEQEG